MEKPRRTILLVDDTPEDRELYRACLTGAPAADYHFVEAALGREALTICQTQLPDCLLLDHRLPDLDGVECLARLQAQHGAQVPPVILLTGAGSEALAVEAMKRGAQDYLVKQQLTPELLRRTVQHAIEAAALQRTLAAQQRESEQRFRRLADAMPQLVWTARADGTVDYYNRRVSAYSDAVRTPEGAWQWEPLLHPDDLAPTLTAWQEAAQRGQPYTWAHRLRMADGTFRWHLSRALPRRDEAGEVVQWFGTATDIHDMRQAEMALRESGQRLTLALEAAAMGVWEWDLRTKRVTWSPEHYQIFGVETFDGTPEGFGRFLHPEDADRVWATVTGAIRDRTLYEAEFRIIRGDGAVRWIANRGRAEYDAGGQPVRLLGIAMDVTARKTAEMYH